MKFVIYCAIIANKAYIGVTGQSFKVRQKQYINDARTQRTKFIFHEELRKNQLIAEWKILHTNIKTAEEAMKLESYYIKLYNTKYPNGYNMTDGGEGTPGWFIGAETRAKISKTLKEFNKDPKNREINAQRVKQSFANMSPIDKLKMRTNHRRAMTNPVRNGKISK